MLTSRGYIGSNLSLLGRGKKPTKTTAKKMKRGTRKGRVPWVSLAGSRNGVAMTREKKK
jgi:hypothetical protein